MISLSRWDSVQLFLSTSELRNTLIDQTTERTTPQSRMPFGFQLRPLQWDIRHDLQQSIYQARTQDTYITNFK